MDSEFQDLLFPQLLRAVRRKKGLSLKQVGKHAKLSEGYLSLVERGLCKVSQETTQLSRLLQAYSVLCDIDLAELAQAESQWRLQFKGELIKMFFDVDANLAVQLHLLVKSSAPYQIKEGLTQMVTILMRYNQGITHHRNVLT